MTWSTEDPREQLHRGAIVVIGGEDVFFADVEANHSYVVFLHRDDARGLIDVDEQWPGWFWARMPSREP